MFASTALLGVCLAIWQISEIGVWPVRLAAFVLGISTVVHLATTLLKLKGVWKWLFAAAAPTLGITAWYHYGVKFGNRHPGSIGVNVILTAGLFWFLVGYALVDNWLNRFALPMPNSDQEERSNES